MEFAASKFFQSIIDVLPVMLFWTDTNHVCLGNNLLHATAFGFSSAKQIIANAMQSVLSNVGFNKKLSDRIY